MIKDISGVVLAGGANRRFNGLIKSNVVIGGKTIISRITATLDEIFTNIIVVTNTPEAFEELDNYFVVGDHYRNIGPLGGIHAALKASGCNACFVFAGDMPFLDPKLILRQTDYFKKNSCDVLIPHYGSNIEPLHAIYNKSILEELEEFIETQKSYAVRNFLDKVNVGYFDLLPSDVAGKPFTNINYPGDAEGLNQG
ncbi:MAG TPA: molybdenum cofactor guanylyltransferase [Bacteroidales bacterium]|nr:molybdenum cofactor guanylyltransferase [Bacteroidales bacterium]